MTELPEFASIEREEYTGQPLCPCCGKGMAEGARVDGRPDVLVCMPCVDDHWVFTSHAPPTVRQVSACARR